MKFYIVDDDITVIKVLENIIEDKNLGEMIGYSLGGSKCIEDIILNKPNIVIIDLLMPEKDGIEIVKEIKKLREDIKFIMISQVSAKDLIGKAYNNGIEFFISKPINRIEVVKIIENVKEKIEMGKTLSSIKNMFTELNLKEYNKKNNSKSMNIRFIFSKLGIVGEMGSKDILKVCEHLMHKGEKHLNYKISEICEILSDNPKAMEQRIRRAINKALSNIASLGIEDYMNDDFITYGNALFNFEDVKGEMDYIRGKKNHGGKISVKKFIEGLLIQNEM